MKKKLLFVALAVMTAATSFAAQYEVNSYAFSQTQRFKITGENLVTNGNFANGRDGWYGIDKATDASAEVWDKAEGEGPNGEAVIKSLNADADQPFCNSWKLDAGSYIVSVDVKLTAAANTSILSAGSAAGAQTFDFFLNSDGSFAKVASSDDAPVVNVATSRYVSAEEWTTLVWSFTAEQDQYLVMNFANIAADNMFTNVAIHQASEVWDVRTMNRRFEFVRKLAEDSNFNVDAAQDAKTALLGIMTSLEEMAAAGELDDPANAEEMMNSFESEYVAPFLDASSQNLTANSFFNYIEDFGDMGNYNRGGIKDGQQIGGFLFHGDNWQHGSYRDANNKIVEGPTGKKGLPYIMKQIQGTYVNGSGSVALANANLPAGKYFIAADMRNAYCAASYALTYNLEGTVRAFVGSDSVSVENAVAISGEDYVRLYFVGTLKEGENFEAGFYWNDPATSGTRFEITNFEVRSFEDVLTPYKHKEAWNKFIAQYNAAVSARENVLAKIDNTAYPWGQDSLKTSLTNWDPYYNAIVAKGWVNADGADAGIATTEELEDWALYQGVELYNEEGTRLEYQLVRGYQNANNYAETSNAVITNLATAISSAEAVLNDPQNGQGDKATFKAIIDSAKETLDDIQKNTNDSRREADEARIDEALQALSDGTEAFKESAVIVPFIDIDFSNTPRLVSPEDASEYYVIDGTSGTIVFNTGNFNAESTDGNQFNLGVGEEYTDVLRVGNGEAKVAIPEGVEIADTDVLRVSFDVWFGKLIGKTFFVNLLNAAGQRVAGFSYDRYNDAVSYNDFNNTEGTGFPIKAANLYNIQNVNNADICTENNRTSIDLIVDYKAQAVSGILNSQKGTFAGELVPFRAVDDSEVAIEDTKIATIAVGSNYNNTGRRCWFDNLTAKKYASTAEGPLPNSIVEVANAKVADNAVYTLSGVRVTSAAKPGLYIRNGKKFVVK